MNENQDDLASKIDIILKQNKILIEKVDNICNQNQKYLADIYDLIEFLNSRNDIVIFSFVGYGFIGQFFAFGMAYFYAKKFNKFLVVDSRAFSYSYDRGILDYIKLDDLYVLNYNADYNCISNINHLRNRNHRKYIEKFVGENFNQEYNEQSGEVFAKYLSFDNFQPDLQIYCLESKKRINMPDQYIGIHIRKGDKIQYEMKDIDLQSYMEPVLNASKALSIDNLYIATDDFRIIEEIKFRYKNLNIFYLAEPHQIGHYQNEFNSLNSNSKKHETYKLLTEFNILTNSQFFIGRTESLFANGVAYFFEPEQRKMISK